MSWTPDIPQQIQTEEVKTYDHGFSAEEVQRIKGEYETLQVKVADGYKVTLDEFKTIVIPHCRIHRTEEFNLAKLKEKPKKEPKVPKEKKEKEPKAPKIKPLTQREIKAFTTLMQKLVLLKAAGKEPDEADLKLVEEYKYRMENSA